MVGPLCAICTVPGYPCRQQIQDLRKKNKHILRQYTNFEGGARAEKNAIFWSNFFKWLKTPSLTCLFKILPLAHKIWPKQSLFSALGELGKSICSTQKKGRQNFRKFENFILDPPLHKLIFNLSVSLLIFRYTFM